MKKTSLGLILVVYLAGIFMGAIDTGIVTPARTIIQSTLGVDEKLGIWLITIYTLAYAASIPIIGKLADKYGRKYVYLISIFLFGTGSFLCGLSQTVGNFTFLLIARVIQAIGGGGILPVATAEIGTTFPKEKRGLALGLVGAVFGIANIFGASAGSAILDIFGSTQWRYIFYINIPITIFILVAGFLTLENNKEQNVKKIDIFGIVTLTLLILSVLYGLRNIDFFNFVSSITSTSVYPFLILFIVLLPIFIFTEKRADDPVMNLNYFKNTRIIITLILSFIVGVIMMGMIFIPQFSENALKIATGKGGYFVIILGLFAGISSPISGKLIDKYGAKIVLLTGFIISLVGALFLIFVTLNFLNIYTVIISLVLIGSGMGFTMGAPLNYMMLENVPENESNSALATLSLVRSIGTAIAPAIMIGFIAQAGLLVQTNIQKELPKEIYINNLPYVLEIDTKIEELKTNDNIKGKLENFNIPKLSNLEKIKMDFGGMTDYKMSDSLIKKMQDSDVTTIVDSSKEMTKEMFEVMKPKIISNITSNLQTGINALNNSVLEMDNAISQMPPFLKEQKSSMENAKGEMATTISQLNELSAFIPTALDKGEVEYINRIEDNRRNIEHVFQKTLNEGFRNVYLVVAISSIIGIILICFYKSGKNIVKS